MVGQDLEMQSQLIAVNLGNHLAKEKLTNVLLLSSFLLFLPSLYIPVLEVRHCIRLLGILIQSLISEIFQMVYC